MPSGWCDRDRTALPCSTRPGWSRAGPSSVRPSTCAASTTPTSACRPAATWSAATLDPDAAPWRIGIEDPHDLTRVLAVVPVRTGAVATSGSARRGEHVVDARTGRPPAEVASVTVVGDDLTWVDIDATAAYAMGPDAARWLDAERHRTGLVVWRDGTVTRLAGPLAPVAA